MITGADADFEGQVGRFDLDTYVAAEPAEHATVAGASRAVGLAAAPWEPLSPQTAGQGPA